MVISGSRQKRFEGGFSGVIFTLLLDTVVVFWKKFKKEKKRTHCQSRLKKKKKKGIGGIFSPACTDDPEREKNKEENVVHFSYHLL